MKPRILGWFLLAVFGIRMCTGCRTPTKSSTGAIGTCTHERDCPIFHECSLLWLGFKVCCPRPPISEASSPSGGGEMELIEAVTELVPPMVAESPEAPSELTDADLRYYYVYLAPSTPAPPVSIPEKSWTPNMASSYGKVVVDPKSDGGPMKLPKVPPSIRYPQPPAVVRPRPPPSNVQHAPPVVPNSAIRSPLSYDAPPFQYSPFSTTIFDVFNMVGNQPTVNQIRKPNLSSTHLPRGTLPRLTNSPPVTSYWTPYHQYAPYSYLRPGTGKN